ncbi:carbohydrate sulfotransferase 12-like isoform X2 [Palaemon carinicauda]
MKILRLRFRSLSILCVLGTLTLVLFYLPPSYSPSQFLLSDPDIPLEKSLPIPDTEKGIQASTGPEENGLEKNEQVADPGIKDVSEPGSSPQKQPSPEQAAEPIPGDKTKQIAQPEVEHPLSNANEHDSYVQDYPDYTPPDFVEVLKDRPANAQSQKGMDKQDNKNKRPARLKVSKVSGEKLGSSSMNPEALRNRALSFPSNSSLRIFMAEQDRRLQHLKTECDGILPATGPVSSRGLAPPPGLTGIHNLLVDRTNNIAYCPIYKAASTSWTITLLEMGGYWKKDQRRKNKNLQAYVSQVFPKISNFAGPALTRSMIRFMVVRHPFERLLSCYRDKFEYAKKSFYYTRYGDKMVRTYRKFPEHITSSQLGMMQEQVRAKIRAGVPVNLPGNPFAEPVGPTFSEFVQYVINAKQDDEHWRSYFVHCSPCHMTYQFVLRFEDINREGREFIEYLNRTSQVEMHWENPTQGGSTKEFVCSYYSQLTKETIKKLVKKYEKDFKLFEYKPDRYLECARETHKSEEKLDYDVIED